MRFGLFLLRLIIVFSIVGTFIPQQLSPDQYISKYGEKTAFYLQRFGLTSLYYSRWFIFLLALLGINLSLCTFGRVGIRRTDLAALHLGLIIILAGSLVTAFWGEEGFLGLSQGEESDFFLSGREEKPLPFKVRLDAFSLSYYPVADHYLGIRSVAEGEMKSCRLKPGESCCLDKSGYLITLKRYLPDFAVTEDGPRSLSDEPDNPAVLIEIVKDDVRQERWLFDRFAGSKPDRFDDLKIMYRWRGQVKEYQSKLEIIDPEKGVVPVVVRVNHPFSWKGYTFYQVNYDPDDLSWTGLSVRKDPGVKVIFIGFLLLNIGVISYYYRKIRERSDNAGSHSV